MKLLYIFVLIMGTVIALVVIFSKNIKAAATASNVQQAIPGAVTTTLSTDLPAEFFRIVQNNPDGSIEAEKYTDGVLLGTYHYQNEQQFMLSAQRYGILVL